MVVRFVIPGKPMGKQRPKFSNAGRFVKTYTPKETINYENRIISSYKEKYGTLDHYAFNKSSKIFANIKIYFELPKSCYGKKGLNKDGREKIDGVYCTTHKDIDNIVKIVFDALNGVCYTDDKQVVFLVAEKLWTTDLPRIEVELTDECERM